MRIIKYFISAVVISASAAGFTTAFAQANISGKHANGQTYSYFFDTEFRDPIVLDTVLLRINYIKDFVIDTTENLRVQEQSTLELGRGINKFYHRAYFKADSLLYTAGSIDAAIFLYDNISYPLTFFETVYQNYPEGKITCTGRIVMQYLKYEEKIPEIKWTFKDSTKTILGMTCFQATCSYRGRDYYAWFTPDIPAMSGPWKFTGLPGLILEIYDSKKEYIFTANSIYRTNSRIYMPDKDYLNTNKHKYEQAQRLLIEHPTEAYGLYIGHGPWKVIPVENITSIMKYDFIELE